MKYQAVFFDLDGTLYVNDQKRVLPSSMEALKKLKEKGVKLGICTSRAEEEMVNFPKEVVELMDIVILSAGALVYEHGSKIFESLIELEEGKKVIDYCNKNSIFCRWSTNEGTGYFGETDDDWFADRFDLLYGIEPEHKVYENERLINILFYNVTEPVLSDIKSIAPNAMFTIMKLAGEITAGDVDKANAVRKVAEHWNIPLTEMMAFGDGYNDITMLQEVGCGVAMGNADGPIKEVANFVTKTFKEDGIAYALEQLEQI